MTGTPHGDPGATVTQPKPSTEAQANDDPTKGRLAVALVYIMFLAGLSSLFAWFAGATIAFFVRRTAAATWANHASYQLYSFWLFLLYSGFMAVTVIYINPLISTGSRLSLVIASWIPLFLLMTFIAWFGGRCIKGLILLFKAQAHRDPHTLGW